MLAIEGFNPAIMAIVRRYYNSLSHNQFAFIVWPSNKQQHLSACHSELRSADIPLNHKTKTDVEFFLNKLIQADRKRDNKRRDVRRGSLAHPHVADDLLGFAMMPAVNESQLLNSKLRADSLSDEQLAQQIRAFTAKGSRPAPNLTICGEKAVLYFAKKGFQQTLTALFAAGMDPNVNMSDGTPAFVFFADQGKTDIMQVFLDAGVDPNIGVAGAHAKLGKNDDVTEQISGVRLLSVANVPVDKRMPAIHYFTLSHNASAVRLLLEAGADPEAIHQGYDKGKPINHAVFGVCNLKNSAQDRELYRQCVRDLLSAGADPNPNLQAYGLAATPLHYAVMANDFELVKLLCDYGADATIRSAGRYMFGAFTTPLELAEDQGKDPRIIAFLKTYTKNISTLPLRMTQQNMRLVRKTLASRNDTEGYTENMGVKLCMDGGVDGHAFLPMVTSEPRQVPLTAIEVKQGNATVSMADILAQECHKIRFYDHIAKTVSSSSCQCHWGRSRGTWAT